MNEWKEILDRKKEQKREAAGEKNMGTGVKELTKEKKSSHFEKESRILIKDAFTNRKLKLKLLLQRHFHSF